VRALALRDPLFAPDGVPPVTTLDPNHPAFDTYRRRLRGEKLPLHESKPEAGFWPYKTRSTKTIAVIMPSRNEAPWDLLAFVGPERRAMNPVEIWAYIGGNPVPPDVAKHVLETGEWPDAAPSAPGPNREEIQAEAEPAPPPARGSVIGDNAQAAGVGPVEEALAYLDVADQFLRDLKGAINDDLTANRAANCRDEIQRFAGDKGVLKLAHAEEKRPYLEKCREIDEKYLRVIDLMKAKHAAIGVPLKVYLDAKAAKARAAAEAERQRLEAEAEARRLKAIEEARARQDEEAVKQIEQVPVAALIEQPLPEPAKVMVGGQRSGRRTGLKKETTYVIEDYEKALMAVKDQKDVQEAVQKAVNRLSKAGAILPGVKKVEGTKL
jgi:hypothetical protein